MPWVEPVTTHVLFLITEVVMPSLGSLCLGGVCVPMLWALMENVPRIK